LAITALLSATSSLFAQDEPEVRRAIPVVPAQPAQTPADGDGSYQSPAWMSRVPRPTEPAPSTAADQPVARAVQADEVPDHPAPPPPAPETTVPPAAPADEADSIRLRPRQGPADEAAEQLAKANGIYARKMFDFAVIEYEKFLRAFPDAPGRDVAWFRLGESHRRLGEKPQARAAYQKLADEFQSGEFFGAGAYRLGESLFEDGRYDLALRYFESAIANSSEQEVRLSARYQSARCLDRLGRPSEAAPIFREVAGAEGANPFRDYARMALADSLAGSGEKHEPLAIYSELSTGKNPPQMRAEAMVKGAALAAELGDPARAARMLESARAMDEAGAWRGAAVLGKLRLAASGKGASAVVSPEDLDLLRGEALAEALSLIATSQRSAGNTLKAREAYDRLFKEFPKSEHTKAARFARIVVFHELSDPRARGALEAFLEDAPQGAERDKAQLLLAEILFKDGKFAEAAGAYPAVFASASLPEAMVKQARYKQAWSLAKAGDAAGAVAAYSAFVEKYPGDDMLPGVILQRGLARQQAKEYAEAAEDFRKVLSDWPKAPEREAALQNIALTLGQMNDRPAMKESFIKLLTEYPNSRLAQSAEFWIGWAEFEEKNYQAAIPRLARAKELDPKTFGERAGLRLALSHYQLGDRAGVARELAALDPASVPREVRRWLGLKSAIDRDFRTAADQLALLKKDGGADTECLLVLAESLNAIGKNEEALAEAEAALAAATEPSRKARGFLAKAEALRRMKKLDEAQAAADEALMLQPEGRLNSAGRIASAEILFARGDFDGAARAFSAVALLTDDQAILPVALRRASEAYRRAGNNEEADRVQSELESRFPQAAAGDKKQP